MGSGSDFSAFQQKIGIPCIDHLMVRNKRDPLFDNTEITTYPLYHTKFDTFRLVNEIMDKGFKKITLMTLIASELTRQLSDSTLLPFNTIDYAKQLSIEFKTLQQLYKKEMPDSNLTELNIINYAIGNFTFAANEFHKRLNTIDLEK
jgi:N-acetylated-alpha-linked acidic dipeptidase